MKKNLNVLLLSSIVLCACSGGSSDGVVKKTIPVYFDETRFNNVDICFFNNNLEIPYVEIKTEVEAYMAGNEMSCAQNGDVYTLTNKANQSTMTLNMSTSEVSISDTNKFRTPYLYKDGNYVDEFYYGGSTSIKIPPLKQERVADRCKYDSTAEYKINLKDYGFAPVIYNNKGYLPIDVLPLITAHNNGTYYLSGDKIYNISSLDSKLLNKITPKTSYSKAYYEYSFNMFTLSIELYYGLKGYSKLMSYNGSTFNYLPNGVLKEFASYKESIINSSSLEKFDEAINNLVREKLPDGGHTYVKQRSFGESKKTSLPSDLETIHTGAIGTTIKKNREKSPDKESFNNFVSLYDTNKDGKNDIGYLTLLDFSIENKEKTEESEAVTSIQTIMRGNGTTKGANDLLNPNASGYDAQNNDIKDVIVDLTVNNGGDVTAEGFLLSWLCGGLATQTLKCSKSQTFSTFTYKYDVNGDNEFNSKDYLPDTVNVYILSSATTYSAANALPYDAYMFYNRDFKPTSTRPVILMGEKTAGGACSIAEHMFLPTGLCYQISCCDVGVDPKNTSICSESGIEPTKDYKLDRETFALRTGTNGINSFIRQKHPISK